MKLQTGPACVRTGKVMTSECGELPWLRMSTVNTRLLRPICSMFSDNLHISGKLMYETPQAASETAEDWSWNPGARAQPEAAAYGG